MARCYSLLMTPVMIRPHDPAVHAYVLRPTGSWKALPSVRTTRWPGMATASVFAAQACATARMAFGKPMRRAISA